jgi:integrase
VRKVRITDATVRGLKRAPKGKRVEVWDELVTGFGVRVTDKGAKSFILFTRFGNDTPTRRKIGDVGKISLAEARRKAKEWLELAGQGRDPKAEAEAARRVKEGRKTFGETLDEYIEKRVKGRMRQARDVERELRNYLGRKWGKRPLEEITKGDVVKLIEEIVDRGAERQAHNIFSLCSTFFSWATETGRVKFSPCAGLKPRKLIGEKRVRTRVLDDAELKAVWKAAEATPYPFGPYVQLLLLTGARKSEASDATWSEFDLDAGSWTVPEARFKSGVVHRVPLSKDAVSLLRNLPTWEGSDFVFTFDGKQPMNGHSKSKLRLDSKVNGILGREAAYQIHDLRRTVRTRLAGLGIPDTIAEQVIGHGRRGLSRVYDQHQYTDEMRAALERWAARLRSIVEPPPPNVAELDEARRARA